MIFVPTTLKDALQEVRGGCVALTDICNKVIEQLGDGQGLDSLTEEEIEEIQQSLFAMRALCYKAVECSRIKKKRTGRR